jgi:hypothetical protein
MGRPEAATRPVRKSRFLHAFGYVAEGWIAGTPDLPDR